MPLLAREAMELKLIDTNIFIYASGRSHPLKDICAAVYHLLLAAPEVFNIDTEVLQEVLHVYTARGEAKKGIEMVRNLLILFPRPFPITGREIAEACFFLEKYPGLTARDALHAAVVRVYGLDGIVSTDGDFDQVTECLRLSPADLFKG